MFKRLSILAVFAAVLFLPTPSYALAGGKVWFGPDQVLPMAEFDLKVEFYNSTPDRIDTIAVQLPCNTILMSYYSATPTPGQITQNNCYLTWGSSANKLNIAAGQLWTATIHVGVGAALGSQSFVTYFTHIPTFGDPRVYDATGNKLFTVTNTPKPTPRPLNFAVSNEFQQGMDGSGIGDTSGIRGLFPPGPVDSLLVLPIQLAQAILNSANGSVSTPTVNILGTTAVFPSASSVYNGLGSTVTNLLSVGVSFFLLLAWIIHVYHRLQRATEMQTHANDTWGVL